MRLHGPDYPSWKKPPGRGCGSLVLFVLVWLSCLAAFLGFVWVAVRVARSAWGE